MDNNRKPREVETRDASARKRQWAAPTLLPDPTSVDGWKFRWIRTSMVGQSDKTNVSSKFREGWEPVRVEDHPEMMLYADNDSKFKGNIEVGGLLLCKMPSDMVEQRDAHYQRITDRTMESAQAQYLSEKGDRRMKRFSESR